MQNTVGFTFGSFDIFHYGRVITFKKYKDKCDILIVAVHIGSNTDKYIQTIDERLGQIWSLKFVDKVITYETDEDLTTLLRQTKPDVHFVDNSKRDSIFVGSYNYNDNVMFTTRSVKYTTSDLKSRILKFEE